MSQPTTLGMDSVSQGLLAALMQDETVLMQAHDELLTARSNYDVASRRYAAMREAVRERIGASPYARNVAWPVVPDAEGALRLFTHGRFRYTRRKVGDAVVEVLEGSEKPLQLEEIVEALVNGALYVRDQRTVNAALINTKGVKKLADGRYTYEKERQVEDLPW